MKTQIELLHKYEIENYIIGDGLIIIDDTLDLNTLVSCDKTFLQNTTINGSLNLQSLSYFDKNTLRDNIISIKTI